jgi:hypothetical protein
MCRRCRHQSSVTAGTIFDKTRTELRIWFAGVWYVTNQKQGVSALGLQRVLGLGSYGLPSAISNRLSERPAPECISSEGILARPAWHPVRPERVTIPLQ